MGEPPPPLPPGPPILLFLLSLAPGVETGKDGGAAFPDHQCSPLFLHRQLTILARACLPHYIRTPNHSPIGHWPLPLAKAEVAQTVTWLESHMAQQSSEKPPTSGECSHLLKRALAAGKGLCPAHLAEPLQKLLRCWEAARGPQKPRRKRRALRRWADGLLQTQAGGRRHSAIANAAEDTNGGRVPVTLSLQAEPKGVPESKDLGGQARLSATPRDLLQQQPLVTQNIRPSMPVLRTEARAAGGTGCQCPDGGLGKAQGHEGKKEARGSQSGIRVPTPRTEEAVWAASALTFLLVVLTLAVLYTRLHRKCRRGRSLYWTTSTEEGSDTVAAVIKRRLLSAQTRRKKRNRQQQQQLPPRTPLLLMSSDSSD